jgi:hypothetical protein
MAMTPRPFSLLRVLTLWPRVLVDAFLAYPRQEEQEQLVSDEQAVLLSRAAIFRALKRKNVAVGSYSEIASVPMRIQQS